MFRAAAAQQNAFSLGRSAVFCVNHRTHGFTIVASQAEPSSLRELLLNTRRNIGHGVVALFACWSGSAAAQSSAVDVREPSICHVRVRLDSDSALTLAARVLRGAGYKLEEALDPLAMDTGPKYVRGAGMLRLSVRVRRLDSGSEVGVTAEVRRLRRLLVFSAVSPVEPVVATERSAHQRAAWGAVSDLAVAFRLGAPRGVGDPPAACE